MALALAACSMAPATAQDRLAATDAEVGPVKAYHEAIRKVLNEAFAPDVTVRAFDLPAFQPEMAIGLRERDGKTEIFTIRPLRQIWSNIVLGLMAQGGAFGPKDGAASEAKPVDGALPADPAALPLFRCNAPVPPDTARQIEGAWRSMLTKVGPRVDIASSEADDEDMEAETFVFAMRGGRTEQTGQVRAPQAGSRVEKLVQIVNAMGSYCQSRDELQLTRIAGLSKDLGGSR